MHSEGTHENNSSLIDGMEQKLMIVGKHQGRYLTKLSAWVLWSDLGMRMTDGTSPAARRLPACGSYVKSPSSSIYDKKGYVDGLIYFETGDLVVEVNILKHYEVT